MNEKELLQKSKAGEEKAFEMLVALHREKIFTHLLSLVKEENTAEDLMQESLIAAYQHIGEFHQKSSFGTWLYRIAHNKAISWLRKQKSEEPFEESHYMTPEQVDPQEVEEVLLLLPQKQRECYRLYVVEERPQKEIAALLQIPLGTVRSRIYYARKLIKESLIRKKTKLR